MEGRKTINDELGSDFVIEVGGFRHLFRNCYVCAEIENVQANIAESVLKTRAGQFIRLTVVGEGPIDAYGIRKGWYVARAIDAEEARAWRSAWSHLRDQPSEPTGPWA